MACPSVPALKKTGSLPATSCNRCLFSASSAKPCPFLGLFPGHPNGHCGRRVSSFSCVSRRHSRQALSQRDCCVRAAPMTRRGCPALPCPALPCPAPRIDRHSVPMASDHPPPSTQRGGCCENASHDGKSVGRNRHGAPARIINPRR